MQKYKRKKTRKKEKLVSESEKSVIGFGHEIKTVSLIKLLSNRSTL